MAYNRNSNYKNYKKRRNYDDQTTYTSGRPTGDDKVDDLISVKALRGLPRSSYSIKADPYTAALPESKSYPFLNRFNTVVNSSYGGEDNIDGGNVQQYGNSVSSKFLKAFDYAKTTVNVNYRYLPILPSATDKIGYNLVDEMRKAVSEALSVLGATTYHNLAINNFMVRTDMNLGSAEGEGVKYWNLAEDGTYSEGTSTDYDFSTYDYKNGTDVLYSMAIYYQLVLQELLKTVNTFNAFRLKQGSILRNAWNREVPLLNSFFGLINKQSFIKALQSLNLSFEGEYLDIDFARQMNALFLVPSRRSNEMFSPLCELQIEYNHPRMFEVYVVDDTGKPSSTPFYTDQKLRFSVAITENDGVSGEKLVKKVFSMWDACRLLGDYFSATDTAHWARALYASADYSVDYGVTRFNNISNLTNVLISTFTAFKPLWSDFREAFDTLERTGVLNWKKGFRPGITTDTDADTPHNLLVDNVYQFIFSGPHRVAYDDKTKRWTTFTKWNMYYGIPESDAKSGGSFLSFSFKYWPDAAINDSDQVSRYVPILMNYDPAQQLRMVSRDGKQVFVTFEAVQMSSDVALSRLVPLTSQSSLQIRVPTVAYNSQLDTDYYSILERELTQLFGMCKVHYSASASDTVVDPDILCIYQIEVSDITNLAITYARANAPFRGTTSEEDVLGFKAVKAR